MPLTSLSLSGQLKTHQEGVIFVLTHCLKLTCDKYSKTKAIHVKQTLEQHRLGKLSSHRNTIDKIRNMEQVMWGRVGWAGLGWAGLGWAGLGWAGVGVH